MKSRAKKFCIFLTAILLIGVLYYFVTYFTGFYIPCLVRLVTGLRCPGCGISHMIINIFHLNFKAAFKSNQLLFLTSPIIAAMIVRETYCYIKYEKHKTDKWIDITSFILIGAFILFTVLRNIYKF